MDATSILIAAKHTSTPPITTLRKVITLTTITKSTAETALWSLVRNACLVVVLFLTVLTLQHVNGQHLISTTIATTTTTETAATFAVKSRNTIKIVTTIMKATTKTAEQPMRALLKVDISEKAGFHNGRTSRSDRAVKIQIPQQLAKKQQQIHKQYEQEPLLRPIQWSLKNIGMHLNSSRPYEVDVFSIGNNISQYKNIGHSARAETIRTSQRNTDHRQEIVQPSSSAAKRRSFLLNSKHSINFSNIDMEVPNIQEDYTRDEGLIHYSMRIYGKSNISNLLNQHPKTGWTRQTMRPIIAPDTNGVAPPRLQWEHRNKRSAIHLNPQLQSNGSNANPMSNTNTNSNTNNKSNQHYRLIALNFEGLLSNYETDMPKFGVRQQREEINLQNVNDVKSKDDVFSITDHDDSDTMKSIDKNTALIDNNSLTIDNSYLSERVNWNVQSSQFEHNEDNGRLLKLVMDGLRMQQLPDMKKVNISQREYVSKYREYFQRIHERKRHELAELAYTIQDSIEWEIENVPLHIVSIKPNTTEFEQYSRRKRNVLEESNARDYTDNNIDAERKTVINNFILKHEMTKRGLRTRRQKKDRTAMVLHFELETNINQLHPGDVEEANVRLMVIHSSALAAKSAKQNNHSCSTDGIKNGKQKVSKNVSVKHILNLKVYQRLRHGKRVLLDSREVEIKVDPSLADGTQSQWMQFDVTKAVEVWLREQQSNLGLEVQCDNCQRAGVRILNYISFNVANSETYDAQLMPVLNIIGRFGLNYKEIRSNKYSKSAKSIYHHHNVAILANGRHDSNPALYKHSCHKTNQRCCRHTMEVVFKKLKGFEFIIQPKVFDAGYCHGRCPPRYNPAHHHAMLQSLIWKQNREHAPRPCCAPSKLVELEVLHVDEKDSEKLKISTWTDMRVVECACS